MIAAAGDEVVTGILGLGLGLLILAVAIYWLVFPMFVIAKLNEHLKQQREIAKALQWIVNRVESDSVAHAIEPRTHTEK